jgi:hypothetical protein
VKKHTYIQGVIKCRLDRKRPKFLAQILDNDIGAAYLQIPIPDLEKALKEAEILADQQLTIPEGFEAGDPQNWQEGEVIQPFESTLQPPKR